MLWFIQHYLWDLGLAPRHHSARCDAWRTGYLPVNAHVCRGHRGRDEAGGDGVRRARHACTTTTSTGGARLSGRRRRNAFLHAVRAHPLAAIRRLAGAARGAAHGHLRAACWATTSSPFTPATTWRNFLSGCADVLDLPVDLRGAHCAARRPRSVGARLPGVHRPRRLRGAARRSRVRRGGERAAGPPAPSTCCCASTALTPPRTSSAASRPSTASLSCTPSSRTRSPSSPCCSLRARTWRSTSLYRERVMRAVERINTRHGNDRLDAHRPAHTGQLPGHAGRLQQLRRAPGQRDLRRHEPGGQGGRRW